MDFNNDFRYDLQVGQVYEQAFAKLLGSKIEIKRDFQCLETGNIFIEYESRNKPSGIASTQADFWCYWLSDNHCVFIKTEALKSLCREYLNTKRDILGGDMNTSKGILLPLNDLINKNLL
jgi:hypothetical protein